MREDPPPDARCRDKFLVQTVAIARDSDVSNIPAIVCPSVLLLIPLLSLSQWQNIEKANKSSIQERKIRVAFLPADGNTTTPSNHHVHGAVSQGQSLYCATPFSKLSNQHLGDEAPPAYGSPAPSFGSPGPDAVTPVNRSGKLDTDGEGQTGPTTTNPVGSTIQSTTNAAASSVASAVRTSGDDLRAQLADATATISRLKQQAEEQGLRQRKSDAINQDARERITTGTTGMGVQQQPADGVPVQIVAALCLLSFLLAYFFF